MEKIKILLLLLILVALIVLIVTVVHTTNLIAVNAYAEDVEPTEYVVIETAAVTLEDIVQEEPEIVCPFTDEEIEMLAKVMYAEANGIAWYGEKNGVSAKARQAAVGWTVLNRYDDWKYDSLKSVITKKGAFAYSPKTPLTDYMLELAKDIVDRWMKEKSGDEDSGRTLPSGYYYFYGDGKENHFSQEWKSKKYWNWSLPDPYKE